MTNIQKLTNISEKSPSKNNPIDIHKVIQLPFVWEVLVRECPKISFSHIISGILNGWPFVPCEIIVPFPIIELPSKVRTTYGYTTNGSINITLVPYI